MLKVICVLSLFCLMNKSLLCLDDDDACLGNVCENEGTCSVGPDNYQCSCQPGFTGELCVRSFAKITLFNA